MGKKTSKKTTKKPANVIPDDTLPQNIIGIGERVEEDKNIYISQSTYKTIRRFTEDKTENESGGVLLGNVVFEFGKANIIIRAFIEAKYCEGTPTTLTFTHESWDYIHKEAEKKYPNYKILGWIHTHPNFGIFLSEYDKFIQNNFFSDENQIAYVVDPIQRIEGFYFWINGKIERCKGFYIFDRLGTDIEIDTTEKDSETKNDAAPRNKSTSMISNIVMGVLAFIVVIMLFVTINQGNRIRKLQDQQQTLTDSANAALYSMQTQISSLSETIKTLQKELDNRNESDEKQEDDDIPKSDDTETPQPESSTDGNSEDNNLTPPESESTQSEETDSTNNEPESATIDEETDAQE